MKSKQKRFKKFVDELVSDAERYMETKKAVRKVSKPKVKTASKQAEKVTYLKESSEYKVASIDPALIVKANRVYLFNTKERYMTELVAADFNGLSISGTTVLNYDEEKSRSTRLRKPEDFLPLVLNRTPIQLGKEWKNLTTKPAKFTGRINKHMIIMKVSDK